MKIYIYIISILIIILVSIALFIIKKYKQKFVLEEKARLTNQAMQEINDLTNKIQILDNELNIKLKTSNDILQSKQQELIEKEESLKHQIEADIIEWQQSAQNAAAVNADIERNNINKELEELIHHKYILQNEILNFSKTEKNKIDAEINEYKESEEYAIQEWIQSAQIAADIESKEHIDYYNTQILLLKQELAEYQAKRDAINQDIVRQRKIEENIAFYSIQLDAATINDLRILKNIRNDLLKVDLLDKLMYDNYIAKPVNTMIKRVVEHDDVSGIYKITNLKTGEIYIGKSTDIKSRWQQHAKSAFHCGTISHSILHTTMEKDGIENFTWEILEEVSKDKLGEREKYWINFYDSKKYGLNEREG